MSPAVRIKVKMLDSFGQANYTLLLYCPKIYLHFRLPFHSITILNYFALFFFINR